MKTKEEIAQWVIDNRYPKSEMEKVSDSEMYHYILEAMEESRSQPLPEQESKSADKQKINELIHEKCDSFCSDSKGRFVFRFKQIEFTKLLDELAQSHPESKD